MRDAEGAIGDGFSENEPRAFGDRSWSGRFGQGIAGAEASSDSGESAL